MCERSKRILFLGNGVNRVVERNKPHSWDNAIRSLEEKYLKPRLQQNDEAPDISFGLRLQRVLNCVNKDEQKTVFGTWLKEVQKIRPNYVHHLLASLVEDQQVDAVMTTNYDFAFEKALDSSFKPKKNDDEQVIVTVKCKSDQDNKEDKQGQQKQDKESTTAKQFPIPIYHVHGAATQSAIDGTKEVIMSMKSYAQTMSGLNRNAEGSWLKLFCENEVHMCGFSFYAEELVMWEALKQRLDYIREKDVFKELGNRLYIYLFYSDSDKAQKEQLADVLKTYSAEPILIPVADGDFANAWMSVYGRITLRRYQLRMTEGESEVLGRFRYPQHDSRNKNVRAAYCPALYYPRCCKFEVPLETTEFPVWLFYCEVHRKVFRWMGLTSKINKGLEALGVVRTNKKEADTQKGTEATVYTCFYLDYTSGELFAVKEGKDQSELSLVTKLVFLHRSKDFDALIEPSASSK